MKKRPHAKLSLFAVLPLLLCVVFLKLTLERLPAGQVSTETATAPPRECLAAVLPEESTHALSLTTDGFSFFSTALTTNGCFSLPTALTTAPTPSRSEALGERALPSTEAKPPLITALSDTLPLTVDIIPTYDKPLLVTGLADTPPLALPEETPSAVTEPIRAVFVATAYGLDFPKSADKSAKALTDELASLVRTAKDNGINTLVFQVRPASDAFYASSLFPTSRELTGSEGDPAPIDVLQTLITIAHGENIRVHAWINPYRIREAGDATPLSPKHPAAVHPSYTFTVKGGIYYQPALAEVRKLITDGIAEIVTHYAVDGILFDDYFYPEAITYEDRFLYQAYTEKGGELSLADWRRDNVNQLIRETYATIKRLSPDCLFGVSPRGIWRNRSEDAGGSLTSGGGSYDTVYADSLAWAQEGCVDYLAPQLYWSFNESAAEFITLATWWQNALQTTDTDLVPALASYRLSRQELSAEIFYLSQQPHIQGYALFRFSYL
ncbi:MAG: family 10 glycosylhydrolase [Clostridia bacterium]|nr:family 10 glycosylhydrolase [Clostridia bacterium]